MVTFRCFKKLDSISIIPICLGSIPSIRTLKLQEYLIDRSVNLKHKLINFSASIFLVFGFKTILIFSSDSSTTSSRGNFLLFIILFAGLVRNPNVPYFVRYNACQALLIDIALIIISYLFRIFPIVELGSIIFIFTLCIFIYSISKCIYGVEPEIPLISKSVRMQI